MRAFVLFLIFIALLAQLFFLARNYGRGDASSSGPMAERVPAAKAPGVHVDKKVENPVRGIEALRGHLLAPDRSPLVNTEVSIVETDLDAFDAFRVPRKRDTWQVTTDAQGVFSVNTLAPGGYVVHSNGPRGAAATVVRLEARGSAGEVALRPAPGRKVSGAVFDWEGRPVKGAQVFVLGPKEAAPELAPYRYLPATTEADGSFLFTNIPAIESNFLAVAKTLSPALIRDNAEGTKPRTPLRFSLGNGVRLGIGGRCCLLELLSRRIDRQRPIGDVAHLADRQ